MAGLTPSSGGEVNNNVGMILRRFVDDKESVLHLAASLAPLDLTQEPYLMTEDDQTLIKSAVNGLNDSLEAVDMTFISRLVGMW